MPSSQFKHLYKPGKLETANIIDEYLIENTLPENKYENLNLFLKKFTEIIKLVPESAKHSLSKRKWITKMKLPFPFSLTDFPKQDGEFVFLPPESVSFIGGVASKTALRHQYSADIVLFMPKECIEKSDILNARWIMKRALYLSWVAKHLQKERSLIKSINWTTQFNLLYRPVLQIKPSGICKKWTFNVFVAPETEMALINVAPTKFTLKWDWWGKSDNHSNERISTPRNNWLQAMDFVMSAHSQYIENHLNNANLKKALILLKVWLSQRGFNQGEGCITGHLMTMYALYLLHVKNIYVQMSPYQLFRTILKHFCNSDWKKDGPWFRQTAAYEKHNMSVDQFHDAYDLVFADTTGFFNLAGGIPTYIYDEFKHEASKTLSLENVSAVNYEPLFVQKQHFKHQFDHYMRVRISRETAIQIIEKYREKSSSIILDCLEQVQSECHKIILDILNKGHTGRLQFMGVNKEKRSWKLSSKPQIGLFDLIVGFKFGEGFTDVLTKGPSGDSPEAKDFRKFWGEKSSLRRFPDGSFLEAILWEDPKESIHKKRLIPKKICAYLLKKYFNIEETEIKYIATIFENVLKSPAIIKDTKRGVGEELISDAVVSFDSLQKVLHKMNLPLNIASIVSNSKIMRHAMVYPPIPSSVEPASLKSPYEKPPSILKERIPKARDYIEVLIYFEISGKWPDELLGIQSIKAEFYCKISEELKKFKVTSIVFPSFLQVLWEGYIFRIKVCYRKEIHLLRSIEPQEENMIKPSEKLEMDIEIIPKLTSSLKQMQSNFSCYSSTVRLVLRWMSSQLMIPHVPHIVVELMVASIFTKVSIYDAPNTSFSAFLRFLHLVSTTDWIHTPIIVNLNNGFTGNEEAMISRKFSEKRNEFPNIFICTPCELKVRKEHTTEISEEELENRLMFSKLWTKYEPIPPTILRLKLVSMTALKLIESKMLKKKLVTSTFMTIFNPSMDQFDVVLKLKKKYISRFNENINNKKVVIEEDPYESKKYEKMPLVDFDIIQLYINDLKDSFGHHCLIFYDEFGGEHIGIAWKPEIFSSSKFSVKDLKGHKLTNSKVPKQILNKEAIIEDMQIIGGKLIESVTINT